MAWKLLMGKSGFDLSIIVNNIIIRWLKILTDKSCLDYYILTDNWQVTPSFKVIC